MKTRWLKHLQKSLKEYHSIRPELKENLESILEDKKDEVEAFAEDNTSIEFPNIMRRVLASLKSPFRIQSDPFLLNYYFAAVYYANAQYFQRDVRIDRERVMMHLTRDHSAYHYEVDVTLYAHRVDIPLIYFAFTPVLLRVIDSESRHVVHQNLLNDKGLRYGDYAQRAYHVVGETLDQGRVFRSMPDLSPQVDPFLNDFFVFSNEQNGHNAANYISRHLALDRNAKRMQLYWLSRLPIRPKISESDSFRELENLLRQFSLAGEEGLKLEGEENIYQDIIELNPYRIGIHPLICFYSGFGPHDVFEEKFEEARKFLIKHFPYDISDSKGVELNGNRVTRFASQLDYVVLKLATGKPKELYAEVRGK